jgi:hypothetical protein
MINPPKIGSFFSPSATFGILSDGKRLGLAFKTRLLWYNVEFQMPDIN